MNTMRGVLFALLAIALSACQAVDRSKRTHDCIVLPNDLVECSEVGAE